MTSTTSTVTTGLGLSRVASATTATRTASTASSTSSTDPNAPAAGCAAAINAGGLCAYTQGATVTADPSSGAWVSLCDLLINGSGLGYSYAGVNGSGPGADVNGSSGGSSPAANGCGPSGTTATGNLAAALGPTAASADGTNGVVADTCGLAVAMDVSNPSTARVLCGGAPGLGRSDVDLANLLAILGPSYAKLSPGLDLNADICGAAAAAGLNDKNTNAAVYCETLSSAENWQSGVPGTTVSLGDNLLGADMQKTFVSAELANNPGVFVTICGADVNALNKAVDIPLGRTDIPVSLGGSAPDVNCKQDANQNPIVSNGVANVAVGDTGAAGGASDVGGTGGTCGAGGGGGNGHNGSGQTTNSCGTAPGSGACTSACNGANASGNAAAVLGQNNASAGPNSGPGGKGDLGAGANACGAGGSGDPSGGSASVTCGGPTTSVQAASTSAPNPPPAPPVAAGVTHLASTGFPLLSGLAGLLLIALGAIDLARRRAAA